VPTDIDDAMIVIYRKQLALPALLAPALVQGVLEVQHKKCI